MLYRCKNVIQYDTEVIEPEKAVALAEEFDLMGCGELPKEREVCNGMLVFRCSASAFEVCEMFKRHFGVVEDHNHG